MNQRDFFLFYERRIQITTEGNPVFNFNPINRVRIT